MICVRLAYISSYAYHMCKRYDIQAVLSYDVHAVRLVDMMYRLYCHMMYRL